MTTASLDDFDLAIIDLLIEDGRMSSAEIAARLDGALTERAIRYRVNALIERKLIQISAIPDPEAFGFNVIADVFIEVEPGLVFEIARELTKYDAVSYVACSTGEVDISIQIVARSNAELYEFVTNVLGKIQGIRKTSTSIVPVILKRFGYKVSKKPIHTAKTEARSANGAPSGIYRAAPPDDTPAS